MAARRSSEPRLLRVSSVNKPKGPGSSVVFRNINYTVRLRKTLTRKEILTNVSGLVEAGQLCAIIGPSGAGKSSLLDVVSGRYCEIAGSRLDGDLIVAGQRDPRRIARSVAFVKQKDLHFGELTVHETFSISARMRLGKSVSPAERKRRIEDLIDLFDLRTCAHTRIGYGNETGRCSGGERKRVSVAQEMLSYPTVLMLDEPTTGLDAASALHVSCAFSSLETGNYSFIKKKMKKEKEKSVRFSAPVTMVNF